MVRSRPYRRLPGLSRGYGGYLQLWEGEDHLLVVQTNGYTEEYRRFYYRDIQALVVQRTRTGGIGSLILGLFTAITAVPILIGGTELWALIFPGLLFLFLLIHVLMGPTCRVRLVTAVNQQSLASIGRLRTFRRVLARIGPRIEQAQGTLAPEEIVARTDEVPLRPDAAPRVQARPAASTSSAPVGRGMHIAAMAAIGLFGLVAAAKCVAGHVSLFIIGCIVFAVSFLFVVLAVARQQTGHLEPALRRWAWYALGYQVAGAIAAWVVMMIVAASHGTTGDDVVRYLVTGSPAGNTPALAAHLFLAIGGLLLGVLGALLLRRRGAPLPPPMRAPGAGGAP